MSILVHCPSFHLSYDLHSYHHVPLPFLRDELAFDNVEQICKFLIDHKAAFYINDTAPDEQKNFDCKRAQQFLAEVYEEKYRRSVIKGRI